MGRGLEMKSRLRRALGMGLWAARALEAGGRMVQLLVTMMRWMMGGRMGRGLEMKSRLRRALVMGLWAARALEAGGRMVQLLVLMMRWMMGGRLSRALVTRIWVARVPEAGR